jgi:hypothetical protein
LTQKLLSGEFSGFGTLKMEEKDTLISEKHRKEEIGPYCLSRVSHAFCMNLPVLSRTVD